LVKEYNIKWVHFGDGLEEIRLKEIAKQKLPTNINVEWKGRVTNKEVLEYYNSENPYLFINVSTTEGVPVSIMEAMSYGIPCIATNVGGTNEIVSDLNGALINCNPTIFELSNKLIFFLKLDKNEYDKFSLNAKLTWENDFYSMKNYNKFIDNIFNL
jgi:glycosyltransferase involved in cell wall biosynthesis